MQNKTKTKKLTRKEREYQRHRQEILRAAEQVFTKKGYHLASMSEIAEEAEFATGTIYNFFQSKQDLYCQVIETIADSLTENFETHVYNEQDPVKAIEAIISLRIKLFQEHRGFFRVFFETSSASRIDPVQALPESLSARYREYTEQVQQIFQRGIDMGIFDNLDPLYLTLSLEGTINAFVSYWTRIEKPEPIEQRIGKLKDIFVSRIKSRENEVI